MRLLAKASWAKVGLMAVAWPLAWLLIGVSAALIAIRNAERGVSAAGGALAAAIGFDVTPRGALLLFGPPLALLALRAIAARTGPR
jgi:hypothetical protein